MAEQGITTSDSGWRNAGFTGPGCVAFNDGAVPTPGVPDPSGAPDGWADAGYTGPDCAAFAAA